MLSSVAVLLQLWENGASAKRGRVGVVQQGSGAQRGGEGGGTGVELGALDVG